MNFEETLESYCQCRLLTLSDSVNLTEIFTSPGGRRRVAALVLMAALGGFKEQDGVATGWREDGARGRGEVISVSFHTHAGALKHQNGPSRHLMNRLCTSKLLPLPPFSSSASSSASSPTPATILNIQISIITERRSSNM